MPAGARFPHLLARSVRLPGAPERSRGREEPRQASPDGAILPAHVVRSAPGRTANGCGPAPRVTRVRPRVVPSNAGIGMKLPGYRLGPEIGHDEHTTIYRAIRENDGLPVIVKTLAREYPLP